MTADEYLKKVLDDQTFGADDPELVTLRGRVDNVKTLLRAAFSDSNPSLRQAGSLAKGTMIVEAYDGDVTCYFPHNDSEPGSSLKEIYESVRDVVERDYYVSLKPSAIRLLDKASATFGVDFHIDVVPGRFVDNDSGDVHLYQNGTEKAYLKTNLQVHVEHVTGSGVRSAVRLCKLWNVRNGINAKTFVLELLVIKLLEGKKTAALSEQLEHVWTELRDNATNLTVEDPANPGGNDLTDAIDACRWQLSTVASSTLAEIEAVGWESVFGAVAGGNDGPNDDGERKTAALRSAAAAVTTPTRPWSC